MSEVQPEVRTLIAEAKAEVYKALIFVMLIVQLVAVVAAFALVR